MSPIIRVSPTEPGLNVGPGQHLVFQQGVGYVVKDLPSTKAPLPARASGSATVKKYVDPITGLPTNTPPPPKTIAAGTRPASPMAPLSQEDILRQAGLLADASLLPQQNEIRRQQELARQQAVADEGALTGFSQAAADYLRGIPEQVGAGYRDAAATVGALGTGIGGAVGQDLAAKQAADAEFAASQGQTGGTTFAGRDVGDTVSYLGGVIPGESIAHQGAAAQAEAAKAVQIPLDAGAAQLSARMAQARSENDQYAQQLISLASTYPGLKAQALQQLNQYEIDKADYRQQVRVNNENIRNQRIDNKRQASAAAETRRVDTENIAHMRRADALDARAEAAQETVAGIKAANDVQTWKYKWANLQFQTQKEARRAQDDARKGKTIDAPASKLLGHVVYKDGTENPSIKVKQSTASTPQQKAKLNRAKATSKARVDAYDYAAKIIGKLDVPDKNLRSVAQATGKRVGRYIADPSQKYGVPGGVFPPAYKGAPATTDDQWRASRSGGLASDYTDAQAKVWAEIDGDGLMSRYGMSRQRVLAIVNDALRRAGWRK